MWRLMKGPPVFLGDSDKSSMGAGRQQQLQVRVLLRTDSRKE
jgi:hypothetical protein